MTSKLRTYEVRINNFFENQDLVSNHIGRTPSQAKYRFWQQHFDSTEYKELLNAFRVRVIGDVKPGHFFGDKEMFDRICERRAIPLAFQGMKISVSGQMGIIVGGNCHSNIDVMFDGYVIHNCHPHWETVYYDNEGNEVYNFKK